MRLMWHGQMVEDATYYFNIVEDERQVINNAFRAFLIPYGNENRITIRLPIHASGDGFRKTFYYGYHVDSPQVFLLRLIDCYCCSLIYAYALGFAADAG